MIPLLDLTRQTRDIRREAEGAVKRVLRSGRFILGPEVARLEREFARFCGARHGVGVASGTDALELSLRAAGVGKGALVATVSFTFFATVDAILHAGAEPLFADVDARTCTLDPADLERRIRALSPSARRRLKAVIPVHLYGQPCDMEAIGRLARRYRLVVIEDAAQAAGATWRGRPVGGLGEFGCFSFFPSKTLGGFGDGVMIVTDSARAAQRLRSLRNHGRGPDGTEGALGRNSRLDELQAALLRVKLKHLARWVQRRRALAGLYAQRLAGVSGLECPRVVAGGEHAFHLYVVRTPHRAALQGALARKGIETRPYYAVPVHRQPLHRSRYGTLSLPETDRAAREALALPLFPELTTAEVERIAEAVKAACRL